MLEFDVMVVIEFPPGVGVRLRTLARLSETKSVCRHDFFGASPSEFLPLEAPRGVDAHARYWNRSHFTLRREDRNPVLREFYAGSRLSGDAVQTAADLLRPHFSYFLRVNSDFGRCCVPKGRIRFG